MNTFFRRSSILALALIAALLGNAVIAPAQSAAPLSKHARKIHQKLAKYETGHYLHLVLTNNTDVYGALGTLSETTFTFTNADNNSVATYRYSEVRRVKKYKQRIGQDAAPIHIHHIIPHRIVPIIITAGVVAAGVLTYEAVR